MESTTGGEIWSNIVLDVHDEPTYGKGDAGEAVDMAESPDSEVEFSVRAQWIRAAVLGANDGMVSTAALMMGVGAVNTDIKSMIVAGLAGLFAGACSMAIGELVSVYSQYDIELAQIKRCIQAGTSKREEAAKMKKKLPCPWKAAIASFLSFVVGALVPLLAAVFFKSYVLRVGMVVAAVSVALLEFGWLSAKLGKAPVVKSSVRVLVGGWLAMGITFGFTKLVGSLV
ncbi:hypothetical protein SAY86_027415 [Trapa natans]|uniref:Vacuolar iron transporter n=1 Tax=Trapa natans TaxID=22666 RepID=A0AAN7QM64_TRANT|nr:hypothetical protein SAY86_027415 [Trapa natans]